MKWLFVLALAVTVCSCGTTVYQLNTTCEKSNIELFQSLSSVLLNAKFVITLNDPIKGSLQAEVLPDSPYWLDHKEMRIWSFQVVDSIPPGNTNRKNLKKMVSNALYATVHKNPFGQTYLNNLTYCNDQTDKDQSWYWDIRNHIQNMCSDIIIIEKNED